MLHNPARPAASRSGTLSVRDLQKRERRKLVRGGVMVLGASGLALLLFDFLGSAGVLIALLLLGGLVIAAGLAAWLWQSPIRGLYVLIGAAAALDVDYAPTFSSNGYFIAHYLPFWMDITAYTNVHIIISVAELFMALLVVVWLLKGVAQRNLSFQKGTLMLPIGLYMAMILVGELHGVGTGGSLTTSLWELRAQIYMFLIYVLACSLIKTKAEVNKLAWILILGTGFRAIEGTIRYFIYFRDHVQQVVDVFPHDQAFFFNAFITLTAILLLYGGSQRLKRTALLLLPWVIFIDFATDRRAAVAALGLGLLLLLIATVVVNPASRRTARAILIALAVVFPPYYVMFQHKSGTLAAPARAIASNFHPDPRDAASNQYRTSEDYDIMATMRSSTVSTLIGYGFGKTMLTPQVLPDISQFYKWWNVMPHNSILWVWMRMGTIGYILFWIMIGTAIVQAMSLLRRLRDPRLQGLALFIGLMLLQEVIFGYLDLQWTDYRNLVTVGLLFALISRVAKIAAEDGSLAPEDEGQDSPAERTTGRTTPGALAVVGGRLKRVEA